MTSSIESLIHSLTLESGFSFGGPLDSLFSKESLQSHSITQPLHPPLGSDHYWMLEAFRTALSGVGISNPNPSVGCVIVDSQGKEISRGFTHAYRGIHAEKDAFNKIQDFSLLKDATAYVSLEPCSHQGNQPPCSDLLTSSSIRRVVISRTDPDPRVNGEGIQKLKSAGKEVSLGLYSQETTAWNFSFFAQRTLGRPCIALKWAQTLDGQLADDLNSSQWITGPTARSYTHWLRQRYDAILVGAQTVLTDLPSLSARDCQPPLQHQPLPIILDPRGLCLSVNLEVQTQLNSKTFTPGRRCVYITTPATLKKNSTSWLHQKKEILILTLPGKKLISELASLLEGREISDFLGRPFQSVMVEGGAKTLTSFLKEGYADLLHTFIAPLLTGGERNRLQLHHLLKEAQKFQLISTSRFDSDILMEMVSQKLAQEIFTLRQ